MKKSDYILLSHGSGGKQSHELIEEVFKRNFSNDILEQGDDSARIRIASMLQSLKKTLDVNDSIAFTTDSYTVSPIFFPGGNIGDLAISGTINDLVSSGAVPLYISVGFIIEEGFPIAELKEIVKTMADISKKTNVKIVTGDTKVVNRNQCDKIFINTSGIGYIPHNIDISGSNAKVGDVIIINGTIGDHGVAVLSKREGLDFQSSVKSDSYPLNNLVKSVLNEYPQDVHTLRDPTRGGIATTLNEIAVQSSVGIRIFEDKIPVKPKVNALCEILGLEAMYIANEGKMLFICSSNIAENVLSILRSHEKGKDSAIIGEVIDKYNGKVICKTSIGGERFVDMLYGEALPRIC